MVGVADGNEVGDRDGLMEGVILGWVDGCSVGDRVGFIFGT